MQQYATCYKDTRTLFEERIQNYKKQCHSHILRVHFSRLAQNVKNYQSGEEMLDYQEDDRRIVSEMERAKKANLQIDDDDRPRLRTTDPSAPTKTPVSQAG
jgi:hypothetical protein